MQVTVKLKCSAHEFYEAMVNSTLAEVKQTTGKEISREDIAKGYKYKKLKNGGKGKVNEMTLHIRPFKEDKELVFSSTYLNTVYETSYTINPLGEYLIEVTFNQRQTPEKKQDPLSKFVMTRQMKKKMKKVEGYCKAVRN